MGYNYKESGFLIGHKIKVCDRYYEIVDKDELILPVTSSSSISAGGTQSMASVNELNPPRDQLYHITQIMPVENVRVYVNQPAGLNRWGTDKAPSGSFISDVSSPVGSGYPVEIFITTEKQPHIKIENVTTVSLTPTIWYYGWKYRLREIPRPREGVISEITVGGLS